MKKIDYELFFKKGCIENNLKLRDPSLNCLPHFIVISEIERRKKTNPGEPLPNYYELLGEGEEYFFGGKDSTKIPDEMKEFYNELLLDRETYFDWEYVENPLWP